MYYQATVFYDGKLGKNSTTSKATVKSTVSGENIIKYYRNDTQYYASFLDENGNPLKNKEIKFNINGIIYNRNTDNNGIAKLNINLEANTYIITAINTATGEQKSNFITVKPVLVGNNDMVKYYRNDSEYTVNVVDGQGSALSNVTIIFNINEYFIIA